MQNLLEPSKGINKDKNYWAEQIFDAKTARNGGVLKRLIRSVTKHSSEDKLIAAAKCRGFSVMKSDTHYLIFCSFQVTLTEVC